MPDYNKIQTPDYDPENPRCNAQHLQFLRECIDGGPEGIRMWNQWYDDKLSQDKNFEIWLQKANLYKAHLKGANFMKAYLQGAILSEANLEGAKLLGANLGEVDFELVLRPR